MIRLFGMPFDNLLNGGKKQKKRKKERKKEKTRVSPRYGVFRLSSFSLVDGVQRHEMR